MRARPHTARDPQSHRLHCPTPNAAASIPTHAPLRWNPSSIPSMPFLQTSTPPLTTPDPVPPTATPPSQPGSASSRLQSAIFPNPTCSTAGRRHGWPRAVRQASDWALPSSHRPRAPLPVHGNKRVKGLSWPYQVTGRLQGRRRAWAPAFHRALLRRHLSGGGARRHGGRGRGRASKGPGRARPRPSGALHQATSPTPQFSRTSSTLRSFFIPSLALESSILPPLKCYQINRSGTTSRKAGLSCRRVLRLLVSTERPSCRSLTAVDHKVMFLPRVCTITPFCQLRFPSPLHALAAPVCVCGAEWCITTRSLGFLN
jgi:hypothetical protein